MANATDPRPLAADLPRVITCPATLPSPSADADTSELPELFAPHESHARTLAANTLRAITADTRVFAAWCRVHGAGPLPAAPTTIAAFIDYQATLKATATVARYRSSIAALHRVMGLDNPCNDEVVRLAVRRMTRAYGTSRKQAEPLNRPHVDRMLKEKVTPRMHRRLAEAARWAQATQKAEEAHVAETMRPGGSADCEVNSRHEAPLIGLRNAALLAVAYDTMLRRADLVALRVEDLTVADDGSGTLLVRSQKDDQEVVGAIKYLALDTMNHVATWLAAAAAASGPLFRPVTKGGRVGATALEAQEVRRLFRELAAAAGVKLARPPSGHSTRVGAVQDMIAAGLELSEVMQAGSWKTATMPAHYGGCPLARRDAARELAALQNRA